MSNHEPVATELEQPVSELRFIGPRNASRLSRLGIYTVRDLLWHFPSRYEDYSEQTQSDTLPVDEKVNLRGQVVRITTRNIFPRRMTVTEAIIQDESGNVRAVWFNQPYLETSLPEGSYVSLAGKVKLDKRGPYLASPVYEKIRYDSSQTTLTHTGRIVPTYPETEGITSKYLRFIIRPLLDNLELKDPLPQTILKKYKLLSIVEALRLVHYPETASDTHLARQRLAFNDLLFFQLKALKERRRTRQFKSQKVPFDQAYVKQFIQCLPFTLTKDQKISAWEILKDIQKPYPMNRLLEGDVGSGKTAVALVAAVQVAQAGGQTVFLAPTEILATQHFQTLTRLTKDAPLSMGLLTSSTAMTNDAITTKSELKRLISKNKISIVVGTHALIQKDVIFSNLVLLVIDEQHRFGVEQRSALLGKREADSEATIPHLLSMTATPIPRTLALTIFGDLDISLLKEKPPGRQTVITSVVQPQERLNTYDFIRAQVKEGRQTFVICPRIELGDKPEVAPKAPDSKTKGKLRQSKLSDLWKDVKAVEEEFRKLKEEVFPDLKIAMLHGKMKPKQKESIMQEFRDGWHDILVATSVIEVGVDVPNATLMIVEAADRFGLAQLHQFRGRIGRNELQSYCFLFPTSPEQTSHQRLVIMERCHDGFQLAEEDMKLRGPGEFFGIKQSGISDLTLTALADVELIKKARLEARLLLKEDPSLTIYPLLKQALEKFSRMTHFE